MIVDYTGTISFSGEVDTYTLSMDAGAFYAFQVAGASTGHGTLSDPFFSLRDPSFIIVGSDDDSGNGTNTYFPYFTITSGNHAGLVSGVGSSTGTYLFRFEELLTGNDALTG